MNKLNKIRDIELKKSQSGGDNRASSDRGGLERDAPGQAAGAAELL